MTTATIVTHADELRRAKPAIVNAMSIDVEDYFQVSAFEQTVDRQTWQERESRVCRNTERLLRIFDEAGVGSTFFVLGWVAERFPSLVNQIAAAGHEIASHGYGHRLVYDQTPDEFRYDLQRARAAIESAAGVRVVGYRAPSYSITRKSRWALDVLAEEGYAYDASVYPIHHDRYGIPDAPRHPYAIDTAAGELWEVPGSTVQCGSVNLPIGGGGYFRLLPYQWTRWGIGRLNNVEHRPAVFYLHPWEIDPDQPRIPTSRLTGIRHYRNLHKTEARLRRLVKDFRFGTITEMLAREKGCVIESSTSPRTADAALHGESVAYVIRS
jgi:polysaccharide deacetylase family protein (PEP-CTERM system associated)